VVAARFPCTGCGACCRKVGETVARWRETPEQFAPLEREALAAFPYEPREDGSCPQLGEDGACAVYADRPAVCQVDAMGAARGWSREGTWLLNALACDAMQREAGLPARWRVLPVVVAQRNDPEPRGDGTDPVE